MIMNHRVFLKGGSSHWIIDFLRRTKMQEVAGRWTEVGRLLTQYNTVRAFCENTVQVGLLYLDGERS